METWKIITNVTLIVIILAFTVVVIVDYIKHKDDESISAEDLKQLRKSHFILLCLLPSDFSILTSADSLSDKFEFIGLNRLHI